MSRRDKSTNGSTQKDTRWDRIRKRYCNNTNNNVSLKTDMVKRFIEMDFVGKHNERMLNGSMEESHVYFDPVLVMNMRHEMFQKIPRKLPLATAAHSQQQQLETCIAHNVAVEEHYIEHELKKFRNQLEKNYKRNQLNLKANKDALKMDNTQLKQSLVTTTKLIEDFYAAPIDALEQASELANLQSLIAGAKQEEIIDNDCQLKPALELARELTDTQSLNIPSKQEEFIDKDCQLKTSEEEESCDISKNISSEQETKIEQVKECKEYTQHGQCLLHDKAYSSDETAELEDAIHERTVRFETAVEIRKFERETSTCSNTSDGIDSVISDIAEEALMELKLEAQAKLNMQSVATTVEKELEEQLQQKPVGVAPITASTDAKQSNELLFIKRLELQPPHQREPIQKDELYSPPSSSADQNADDDDDATSHSEQDRIIGQLFQARTHTNTATLRKYFLKWIHYTTMEKIERKNCKSKQDQVQRINAFLDKVRREKVRQIKSKSQEEIATQEHGPDGVTQSNPKAGGIGAVIIAKKYKNKIKIQQDIIDLQRVKLERQERLIMELKLHKLSDEAKEARQDIKNELKAVIKCGDPKTKAKAKCLQLIGNLRDEEDEDEFARLKGRALLVPKFLQNMQERALERSIKHEQAKQRRLQQEADREALKIAAEEAKRMEDEEAKRMRIEILKERRRQEKMAKILKERERQRAAENQIKAQGFCRRLLLRRVGMEAFKRLLQRKHDNQRKSDAFRRQIYKRTCFRAWRAYVVLEVERKQQLAETFSDKLIKRHALHAWQEYINEQHSKWNVAIDWCELKLTEEMFINWLGYTRRMRLTEATKMQQAAAHHEWHLKWKVLTCWQRLPQILQIEKETEERRQRWRLKIWELLPDYSPNRADLN